MSTTRGMTRLAIGVFLGVALVIVTLTGRDGAAQQPAAPEAARFTGKQTLLETASSANLRVARGKFEAGTRSFWHSHDGGQLLFVQEGRARVQRRGEPIKEMGLHESDYTGPGVVHWHGAAPEEGAVLAAVGFGGPTQWMEEVTDEQYRSRTR